MSNQIIVHSLGESVTEATVSKWLKQVGETVDADEPVVELESDKVNLELPSPISGTLSKISVKEGDIVKVGALLGLVNEGKSTSTSIPTDKAIKEENYVPPKKSKKKNVEKPTTNQNKKTTLINEETLTLKEDDKEKNKNATLILDTLSENEVEEKEVE